MNIEEHKQTAIDFFDQMSNGNVEGFVNLYHEGGAVWTSGNTLISGTQKKAAILEFAGEIYKSFPHGIKFKIISMTAEDDRVAVEAESDGLHVSGLCIKICIIFCLSSRKVKSYFLKNTWIQRKLLMFYVVGIGHLMEFLR